MALYRAAFPQEDLVPLVDALLSMPSGVLSFAACRDGNLAGHAAFTLCGVSKTNAVAGLAGPVAVSPSAQRQGIGKALIAAGLDALAGHGARTAFVLGDPAYYGKLGYSAEDALAPPYRLPDAWRGAWQSVRLDEKADAVSGTLTVPPPWQDQALWGP